MKDFLIGSALGLIIAIATIAITFEAKADHIGVGDVAEFNFVCLHEPNIQYLKQLVTNPDADIENVEFEMSMMVQTGQCVYFPMGGIPFEVVEKIDDFIDFQNDHVEIFTVRSPNGTVAYTFAIDKGQGI